ncbi:MAG TPA: hypothetical protein VES20_02220 [Bryobacteraceae bacterium]|nr:hypothetical protein [Bryobacteraceae bacterium]
MVAFRKFALLAMFALLLGAGSAYAQVAPGFQPLQCTANAGVPPVVRAEGFTELVGDLVLTCTGGNPAVPFLANFQVFLNTNITSRLTGDLSEALLMIDEPGVARNNAAGGVGTPTPFCVSPGAGSNPAPAGTCNPPAANPPTETFQSGSFTVFRGSRVQENVAGRENALVWPGVPVTPPGSNRQRIFRFTNIRANASGLGASQTLIPTPIVAFVSVTPQGTLPIDNPQQTLGYVQQGMLFDIRNCENNGGVTLGVDQCVSTGESRDFFGDPLRSGALGARGLFRFREGFQTAFKPQVAPGQSTAGGTTDPALPGQVFNAESGFVRIAELTANVGLADSGTRLSVRLANVPANLRIFVSTTNVSLRAESSAVFVSTDPSGASNLGAPAVRVPTAPFSQGTLSGCAPGALAGSPALQLIEVPVVNGTGAAVWEVTSSNPSVNEEFLFAFGIGYRSAAGATQVGLGTATAIGNLAPFYTGNNADRMGGALLPIPRFAARTETSNVITVQPCQTNLLFPYVTNQAGFDTGIAIANTSEDPFADPQNRRQSGRCRLNYFGRLANGNPPSPLNEQTDREVAAGETITMVLSTGGSAGLRGSANFQGYIIAQCDFRFAHGFAFITDGPIGQARVAEGYLALVLDGPNSSGRVRGNETGESRGH